ncbi:MAG: hypothetical protein JWO79_2321 [Actinomycetia bacterium]|nr:hypothetical protein [Actinomycetes bacterium]
MAQFSRRFFLGVTGSALAGTAVGTAPGGIAQAAPTAAKDLPSDGNPALITSAAKLFTLENDALRVGVRFVAGSLHVTSVYNKHAHVEYQTIGAGKQLFSYTIEGSGPVTSNDGLWTFGAPTTAPLVMHTPVGDRIVGQELRIPLSRTSPRAMTVTAVFEIYNDAAGLRFYTLIRNEHETDKLKITDSVVMALGFANKAHTIHYVTNALWKSTRAKLAPIPEDTSSNGKRAELAKKALTVYDAGHGWTVSPELNWKTQNGNGDHNDAPMLPPFASLDVWSGAPYVSVRTNPVSLQLVLFPKEEFEYLSVNVTVFEGGVVEGKMAEQEHFRKRFRYNHLTSLFNTNDWDYRGGPSRVLPPDYYYNTVIPKANAADLDMVMLDDYWNTTRDTIEPSDDMKKSIHSLGELSQTVVDNGMIFGLWFSMSGGGHNQGRDLADPANLAFKKDQIETLINQFHLSHQMVDLTEYWQNEAETSYSSPSDNVYRKAVLVRNLLNGIVEKYPFYRLKLTTELDIYPSQGDRSAGLMHLIYNGWVTGSTAVTGESLSLRAALVSFGAMPMESAYMNIGAMSARMEDYYGYMAVRNVKFPGDPGDPKSWPAAGVTLMAAFNKWRKSARVSALTEELFRPIYLGSGWDARTWDPSSGPYAWLYTDAERSRALVIATGGGGRGGAVTAPVRWLDERATYLVSDITLDDRGGHSYAFRGTFTGAALRKGLPIDLKSNPSRGKAFWIEKAAGAGPQVQYADEHVTSWTTDDATPGQLKVSLTGEARATATIIVADPSANTGAVRTVELNAQGLGTITVNSADLVPAPQVRTEFGEPVTFAAELLTRTSASSAVDYTVIGDGNAAGGSFLLANFTAVGQRVEFAVHVDADGQYDVSVRYSEKAARGLSQAYVDGQPLGPEINHSAPPRSYKNIELRERPLGSLRLKKGWHRFAFEATGANAGSFGVGIDYIALTPSISRSPIVIQAETSTTGSSKTPETTADIAAYPARAGAWRSLPATAVGDWIEFTVPVPAAGAYRIVTTAKRHMSRGQYQVLVEGRPVGPVQDLYMPLSDGDYQYADLDSGVVTLSTPGPVVLRYLVTGKNSGSDAFRLAIDQISLIPTGRITLSGPASIKAGQRARFVAKCLDFANYHSPADLLWSIDGAGADAAAWVDSTGHVTGLRSGEVTVRVSSQIDPRIGVSASLTIR